MSEQQLSLPAQIIYPGDLLDRGMDKLRTVHLALSPDNKGWHDETAIFSAWATLEAALRDLEPVREALQNPSSEPKRMVGGDRHG